MILIEIKLGNLELDIDEDEIYMNILFELSKTQPYLIEAELAEDS